MRIINKIILHCSATPEGRDVDMEELREWHKARGFSDVGYHYVIHINGLMEVGRPIGKIGAHCKGYNKDSIGICYIGGLDKDGKPKDTRTEEQKQGLFYLVSELKKQFMAATIHGHNEFSDKACPCFDVSKEY